MRNSNKKNIANYWISYTDLMAGFLIIFILISLISYTNSQKLEKAIHNKAESYNKTLQDSIISLEKIIGEIRVQLEEYKKLEEIKTAIKYIDTSYFTYNDKYKKHILNINIHFKTGQYKITNLSRRTQRKLIKAGKKILSLLRDSLPKEQNIKYLIIIEGQASKDGFDGNDKLSYKRALALREFWKEQQIDLAKLDNCELVIAGSGEQGVPRQQPDIPPSNQRFLIQIIPKIGVLNRELSK